MYFGIKIEKWKSSTSGQEILEHDKMLNYLLTFKEIEKTEYPYILKFDLKDIRKLKIQSLHDEALKTSLEKLQKTLNDKTKITIYGDKKPVIESASTGTSGMDGSTGVWGRSGISATHGIDYLSMINEAFEAEEIML